MSTSHSFRLCGAVVLLALCMAVGGCGTKYDGVSKEESQPVVDLLLEEGMGQAAVDRVEGKKVKDDLIIVRALYQNKAEGRKMELLFRVESGKITGRGFNKFGDNWRNHMDDVVKEIH